MDGKIGGTVEKETTMKRAIAGLSCLVERINERMQQIVCKFRIPALENAFRVLAMSTALGVTACPGPGNGNQDADVTDSDVEQDGDDVAPDSDHENTDSDVVSDTDIDCTDNDNDVMDADVDSDIEDESLVIEELCAEGEGTGRTITLENTRPGGSLPAGGCAVTLHEWNAEAGQLTLDTRCVETPTETHELVLRTGRITTIDLDEWGGLNETDFAICSAEGRSCTVPVFSRDLNIVVYASTGWYE